MKKWLALASLLCLTLILYAFAPGEDRSEWSDRVFHRLASEVFSDAHYRADTGVLTLCFRRGAVYEYRAVPPEMRMVAYASPDRQWYSASASRDRPVSS